MMPVKFQKIFYGSSQSTFKIDLEKGTTKKKLGRKLKKENRNLDLCHLNNTVAQGQTC